MIKDNENNIKENINENDIQSVDNVATENLNEQKNEEQIITENNIETNEKSNKESQEKKPETTDKKNNADVSTNDSQETNFKQVKNSDNSNVETKDKKSKKFVIGILISIIAILFLFFVFSTVFSLLNSNKTTIINGIKINNIDVSGLSKEEALDKITSEFNKKIEQQIKLKHNDYETEIFPNQLEISFNLEEATNMAYEKGRNGNIFTNNYDILYSMLFGFNIDSKCSYNEDSFKALISEMETNFNDKFIESNYYIDGNNLILSKGQNGVLIDKDALKSEVIYKINCIQQNNNLINIPVYNKTVSPLNVNTVHEEIYREPKDAYFTTEPYAIYPHVDGIDFAISVEEATSLFNSSDGDCTIPLKILSPNVKTYQLGAKAFPHLLGTYSTTFSTSNVNRSTNIRLAAAKINDTIIMPNEVFSYNQTVGKRTAAAGFKTAAVYSGGKVVDGIGGGICQVSSTLYNAALLANLEIVARDNHAFNPGYVPAGRDATVSWGGPDFQFKNSRNYPIRLVCTVSGGKITVQLYGLKTENEYDVEIQSYITQYIPYKTITEKNPNLPKGQTQIIESGSNGCRSVAYRILKQNGVVVSKTLLSNDTYNPHNRIVSVGTKEIIQEKPQEVPQSTPQENTQEPSQENITE